MNFHTVLNLVWSNCKSNCAESIEGLIASSESHIALSSVQFNAICIAVQLNGIVVQSDAMYCSEWEMIQDNIPSDWINITNCEMDFPRFIFSSSFAD